MASSLALWAAVNCRATAKATTNTNREIKQQQLHVETKHETKTDNQTDKPIHNCVSISISHLCGGNRLTFTVFNV